MPEELRPLLSANNMLDFFDYIDNNLEAKVRNLLGGESKMTTLTDSATTIRLTAASDMYVQLLRKNDGGTLICTIVSVTSDKVSTSTIAIYDENWKELSLADYITLPKSGDIVDSPVVPFIRAKLDGLELLFKATSTNQVKYEQHEHNVETRDVRYVWDGSRFNLNNNN